MPIFLYALFWILSGILIIKIFDYIDGHETNWKSLVIGAISGPAGGVVLIIYIVLNLILKLYDSIVNKLKGN